jgi:hypothetical protein
MDTRFEPDAKLEALDAKLEAICANFEKLLNGSEDDIIRPDFDDDDDIERMNYREDREYKRYCQMNSFDEEEEEDLIYDDSGEMTPRGKINTNYEQFYESVLGKDGYNDGDVAPRGRKLELDLEVCSECQLITKIIAYGWRDEHDNLCFDCVNLPGMYAFEC